MSDVAPSPAATVSWPPPAGGSLGTVATRQRRILARALDLLVFLALAQLAPPIGPVVGLVLLLAADGTWPGQSPGKRLLGVRVVRTDNAQAGNLLHSVLRNLPLGVAMLMLVVPVLGLLLFVVLGLPLLLAEAWFIRLGKRGRR